MKTHVSFVRVDNPEAASDKRQQQRTNDNSNDSAEFQVVIAVFLVKGTVYDEPVGERDDEKTPESAYTANGPLANR